MSIRSAIRRPGHRVKVERATETTSATGSRTRTWVTTHARVVAWVQDAGATVVAQYAARQLRCQRVVYVAEELDILEGDRLTFNDETFSVLGVKNAAGLNRLWRIDVGGKET